VTDQPEGPPASAPSPARRTHVALGVLIAVGLVLAIAAVWFALFGRPGRIGDAGNPPATGTVPASTAASPSVPATPAPQLTAADVREVLSRIDYRESSDASTTEYNHALSHMLAGVDLAAFAHNTLESTSAIQWTDVGAPGPRTVTGAEKRRLVDQSAAYWISHRDARGGDGPPLNAVWGVMLSPPVQIDRNLQDSYYEVMAQGLVPLGLMFGAQDSDNEWGWTVTGVSVVASNTADVTYLATSRPHTLWHFANPKLTYTKRLAFSYDRKRGWRLSAWPNYGAVLSAFDNNLVPPGAPVHLDEWWGAF
jgi:hypothetical protein